MPPKATPNMHPVLSMTLRKNRAAAPGAVDKPRPKRTPAEVAAEKTEKERLKSEKTTARTTKLKAVSEIEDRMHQLDTEREKTANHPPPPGRQKVARAVAGAPTTPHVDEAITPAVDDEQDESQASPMNQDGDMTNLVDETELSQTSREESEVVVSQGRTQRAANLKNISQTEKSKAVNIPNESEDSERVKSAKKKQRNDKKSEVRQMVQAGREVTITHTNANLKRKVSDGRLNLLKLDGNKIDGNIDHNRPASKKIKPSQGGLRPEFVRELAKLHANTIATLNVSNTTRSSLSSMNDPAEALGGLSSDEDTTRERLALGSGRAEPMRYYGGGSTEKETKIRSLVKVVPTTSTPELVPGPRRRTQGRAKKEDITTENLPPAYREGFRSRFIPLIRQYTSTLGPWEAPPEDDIIALFAAVFDLEAKTVESGLVSVVLKLVEDHFDSLHLHTQEKRAEYVKWLLGGVDDKNRPFYYKECEPGKIPIGIFQSYLVSVTLSNHYVLTTSVDRLEQTTDTRPVGALVLAVQAVKCSLLYWKDGVRKVPNGPTGYFSKNNWGDHMERREGKNVTVKTTTAILKIVKKLSEIQWDKIVAAAEDHARPRKETVTIDLSIDSDDSSSDFEVLDGDEDLLEENHGPPRDENKTPSVEENYDAMDEDNMTSNKEGDGVVMDPEEFDSVEKHQHTENPAEDQVSAIHDQADEDDDNLYA